MNSITDFDAPQTPESIATYDLVTVQADASIEEAHTAFHRYGIRHLPVLDGETLVGVLSERDVRGTFNVGLRVRDLMSSPAITVDIGTSAAEAAGIMRQKKISALIVLESGRLAGIVTSHDLLRIVETMGANEKSSFACGLRNKIQNWAPSMSLMELMGALGNSGI